MPQITHAHTDELFDLRRNACGRSRFSNTKRRGHCEVVEKVSHKIRLRYTSHEDVLSRVCGIRRHTCSGNTAHSLQCTIVCIVSSRFRSLEACSVDIQTTPRTTLILLQRMDRGVLSACLSPLISSLVALATKGCGWRYRVSDLASTLARSESRIRKIGT